MLQVELAAAPAQAVHMLHVDSVDTIAALLLAALVDGAGIKQHKSLPVPNQRPTPTERHRALVGRADAAAAVQRQHHNRKHALTVQCKLPAPLVYCWAPTTPCVEK